MICLSRDSSRPTVVVLIFVVLQEACDFPRDGERGAALNMSGNGSDFENDGDYLQEPSAKRSKLDETVEEQGQVLQLHTDWVARDANVRHAACKLHCEISNFFCV